MTGKYIRLNGKKVLFLFLKRFSGILFVFLLFTFIYCNDAKPINIDISTPAGLGALALEEIVLQGSHTSDGGITPPPPPPLGPCNGDCVIFISTELDGGLHDGNYGGPAGADAVCQAAAEHLPSAYQNASTYKAVVMDGVARDLTTDWALHPNTSYKNPNTGRTVNTDSNGLFQFSSSSVFNPGYRFWTGIYVANGTWNASTSNGTCVSWTSNAFFLLQGLTGNSGIPQFIDDDSSELCFNTFSLICVGY